MMIQPYYASAEYKVVLLAGKASHFVDWPPGGHAFGTDQELFGFAERALQALVTHCPYVLSVEGMWRVDIMMNSEGSFVVNEFEHLDALYSSKTNGDNIYVVKFLEEFWFSELRRLIV